MPWFPYHAKHVELCCFVAGSLVQPSGFPEDFVVKELPVPDTESGAWLSQLFGNIVQKP